MTKHGLDALDYASAAAEVNLTTPAAGPITSEAFLRGCVIVAAAVVAVGVPPNTDNGLAGIRAGAADVLRTLFVRD